MLTLEVDNGAFVAYSSDELEKRVGELGGKGSAMGLIRDLRDDIKTKLE